MPAKTKTTPKGPAAPWYDRSNFAASTWNRRAPGVIHPKYAFVDATNRWIVQIWLEPPIESGPFANVNGWYKAGISYYPNGPQAGSSEIIVNWSTIQRIKQQLFGDALAIEVYPAAADVVDQAPMRWLWVAPGETSLPFNLDPRKSCLTATQARPRASKQPSV